MDVPSCCRVWADLCGFRGETRVHRREREKTAHRATKGRLVPEPVGTEMARTASVKKVQDKGQSLAGKHRPAGRAEDGNLRSFERNVGYF